MRTGISRAAKMSRARAFIGSRRNNELKNNQELLKLDVIRGRLAVKICDLQRLNQDGVLYIRAGRHPLLDTESGARCALGDGYDSLRLLGLTGGKEL